MKRIIAALAVLVLAISVGACGGSESESAEQKKSGFYNMETLATNIDAGTHQSEGITNNVTCVLVKKQTAKCENVMSNEAGEHRSESATVTINPAGTNFVFSEREGNGH